MKTFELQRLDTSATIRRRHRARTLVAVLGTTILSGFAVACTEPVPATPVATVSFNTQADSVLLGKTYQLAVTVRDASSNVLTGRKVTFASEHPSVAEPDASGLVTTKLGDQVAIMKATVEGKTAQMPLKVLVPATKLVAAPATNEVALGSTRALAATLTSASGEALPGRSVTWKSSNLAIAVVSASGVVTAVGIGSATITATGDIDNVSGTATFNVTDPVASIRLTPSTPQLMRVGGTLQVTATPLNAAGLPISGLSASWSSPNPAVATVGPTTGLVTAVGAAVGGAAQTSVTVDIQGRTASLPITVTEIPPKTVTLSPTAFTLANGTSRQLIPVVVDSAGTTVTSLTTRNVQFTSSNQAVANVSSPGGVVNATGGGVTLISATVDGVKSNDVTVTVDAVVASIRLTPFQNQTLRVGGTLQVTATPIDNNNQPIPGKTVNWSSGNTAVVSVSATSPTTTITALSVGSTSVTAEVDGRTASINISVTLAPIASVTLAPATDVMIVGDTRQYTPVVTDTANRNVGLVGRNVTTQSSNIQVATMTAQGLVTGFAVGSTNLTMTVDTATSNVLQLNVVQPASVTVTPNPGSVKVGAGLQLTVVVKDAAGNILTITKQSLISFQSNAGGIATVSQFGLVNGVAVGTAVITANVNGVTGTATVNVVP
jgi:trimeric autotransporter adhesin